MALEAVVFPQIAQDLFTYAYKDMFSIMTNNNSNNTCSTTTTTTTTTGWIEEDYDFNNNNNNNYWSTVVSSPSSMLHQQVNDLDLDLTSSSPENCAAATSDTFFSALSYASAEPPLAIDHNSGTTITTAAARRKRRRTRSCKNKEEVENQRMTHIAVERNRRKQMNDYLSVLRSLMPASYVQRGDQASIIGGAINFVKELEQLLQSLEAQKQMKELQPNQEQLRLSSSSLSPSPFTNFFSFPQYSSSTQPASDAAVNNDMVAENRSAVADIEVTMVESHASLKVLSRRRPRQLLKMVAGFQTLRLTVLHLNVTTAANDMVLYSFSVKVEEDCQQSSVDDIAAAVHQMMRRIQEEATLSS
ncbi:hypothetical protein Sjap_018824 [Stephania japonica]|uniref:BHLH domain-containing protein n=1 Tax=Stephania japonica TaxID=461633 RepID=A0AAP0I8M7_9MAGN